MFERFAELLLNNSGLSRIIETVSEELEVGVALRDLEAEVHCSGSDVFCERQTLFPLRELMRIYTFFEIRVANRPVGHLILDIPRSGYFRNEHKLPDCIAVIRIFYGQKAAEDKLRSNYRNEFVQDLLYNKIHHEEELKNRARTFQWRLEGGVVCLIIKLLPSGHTEHKNIIKNKNLNVQEEETQRQSISFEEPLDLVQSRIRAFFPKSVFARFQDMVVFLLTLKLSSGEMYRSEVKDFQLRLTEILDTGVRDAARRYSVKFLGAVGGYRPMPLLSHESYREAQQALMILSSGTFSGDFVFWEQLGGTRLLATLASMESAREFCQHMLQPLLQESAQNTELLNTMLCLEDCNGNLNIASQKLSLHYNTLRYRVNRVSELLGLDQNDGEQRFNLSLALRLYRLMDL